MKAKQRCLTMVKGAHRYVFQYADGQEAELLASFLDLARDDRSGFDWFDAAALSYQMGRQPPAPAACPPANV